MPIWISRVAKPTIEININTTGNALLIVWFLFRTNLTLLALACLTEMLFGRAVYIVLQFCTGKTAHRRYL
jgi:hypothetical protein